MTRSSGFRQWAMKLFIGAVILAGLFGPYIISIILSLVCLASWLCCRNRSSEPADTIYSRASSDMRGGLV